MLKFVSIFLVAVAVLLTGRFQGAAGEPQVDGSEPGVKPVAVAQTEPVPSQGDAADDPAIWIHPVDPALSLVLGTDKKGGLNVFDLEGKRLQIVSKGARPNNVDVLYDFPLAGTKVDLAVAGTRSKSQAGVAFWRIDPATRQLSELGSLPAFTVFGGGEPYGSCVYRSPRDKAFYVFITSKEGNVEQYRIEDSGRKTIRATLVRTLHVGSTTEAASPTSTLVTSTFLRRPWASGNTAPSRTRARNARWGHGSASTVCRPTWRA